MPSQETTFLNDTVLYWEKAPGPDRFGQAERKYLAPVEVAPPRGVRIDDKKKLMRDAQGNNVMVDAQMVSAVEFKVQSVVAKMTMDYYQGTGSDETPLELFEVVAHDEVNDIKGRHSVHLVGLNRYRGDLPEVAS